MHSLNLFIEFLLLEKERVKPERPAEEPLEGIHVYVGGVPGDMSKHPTISGCIRGLKIGDTIFELQEEALKDTSKYLI